MRFKSLIFVITGTGSVLAPSVAYDVVNNVYQFSILDAMITTQNVSK
jgi:uncharacterized membrane protein